MIFLGAFLAAVLVTAILAVIPAFIAMLLLGGLHHLTGWETALGFWACYIITILVSIFLPSQSKN